MRARLILVGALIGVAAAVGAIALLGRRAAVSPPVEPDRSLGVLLPEADGRILDVAMHWVPEMDAVMADTYTDFLRALPADVGVTLVVASGMSAEARQQLMSRLRSIAPDGSLARRVHLVECPGPITTWSKDRALVSTARTPGGAAWIIPPLEPRKDWVKRHNDWGTVACIAQASGGKYESHVAPFDFDAGDFAIDRGRIIVDANLVEKNRRHGASSPALLHDQLSTWFRAPVVVLGKQPGDTPKHHLSMYMTPLQPGVMLVGDPAAARAIVGADYAPGDLSADTDEPLRADFSERMVARFDRVAKELATLGYRVERIPNVPFDDKTYFAYTNAVFDVRDGKHVVFFPVYDVPALDAAARQVYERLGWEVRPVRVRKIYPHHGTIGCLVNVLARG